MKRGVALFCMILIVLLPLAEAQFVNTKEFVDEKEKQKELEEEVIGENIVVNIDEYQPKIVKSSLIENGPILVYALLKGTPSNPAITINKIRDVRVISVNITTIPETKQAVIGAIRYIPSRNRVINYDNLGYLVIPLKQIPKETDVPNNIIIHATLRIFFDVSEGLFASEFEDVLSEQSHEEWLKEKDQHKFFTGYTRASEIKTSDASFVIYDPNTVEITTVKNLKEGQTSNVINSRRFGLGVLSRDVFDKFRVRLDSVTGQTSKANFIIMKEGKALFKELHKGSSLYEGSQWFITDIQDTKDKGNNEVYRVTLRSKSGDKKTIDLSKNEIPVSSEIKISPESKGLFDKALDEYTKVIDNYPTARDENDRLYAARAQERIADIYYNDLYDLYKSEESYQKLLDNYKDEVGKIGDPNVYSALVNSLRNEKLGKAKTIFLEDNDEQIRITLVEVKTLDPSAEAKVKLDVQTKNEEISDTFTIQEELDKKFVNKWDIDWKVTSIKDDQIVLGAFDNNGLVMSDIQPIILKLNDIKNVQINKDKSTASVKLGDINLRREAHVTIIPESEKAFSQSDLEINIPIEKRLLGPAIFSKSLDKEIGQAQDLIKKLDKIIANLEKIHKFWSQFCFATFGVLWAKNLLLGGKDAISRQRLSEKWKDKWANARSSGYRKSYDSFIFDNRDAYDKDLQTTRQILGKINSRAYLDELPQEVKNLGPEYDDYKKDYYFAQEEAKAATSLEDKRDLFRKYALVTANSLSTRIDRELGAYDRASSWKELGDREKEEIKNFVQSNAGFKRELELRTKGQITDNSYEGFYNSRRHEIVAKFKDYETAQKYEKYFGGSGFEQELQKQTGVDPSQFKQDVDSIRSTFYPPIQTADGIEINLNDVITGSGGSYVIIAGRKYNVVADKIEPGSPVTIPGLGSGRFVAKETAVKREHVPKISVVEEGRQKGRVERISIDATKYAEVEYATGGGVKDIRVFERPGVNSQLGKGSDVRIGSLENEMSKAREDVKIDPGKREYLARLQKIQSCVGLINGRLARGGYTRGSPVVSCGGLGDYHVESINTGEKTEVGPSCTDFMSPTDCKLLFNACDPVICPASRCNMGGNWQVDNVVQTGIIGSIALCLPNYKEGIVMPVCLTGILAGLQNIKSVLQGYEQCLKVAKVQGQSVGICDRLRSFYLCDILWKEAIAVFNIKGGVLGFLAGKVFGGGSGGGEYSTFQKSVENSVNTLKFFTQSYAKNVFASYSGGSLPEIGAEVCKSMVSQKLPGVGNFLAQIQKPESPPQFTAFFDETPYSDIVEPPQSQYSVFYHIYAGENEDIVYSVYLKGSVGNTPTMRPAFVMRNRRLPRGKFESQNIDKLGVAGFNEICVEIRSIRYGVKTECGFGKVSSSFALNKLNDLFVSQEATKQITSEEECVPETTRLTSLEFTGTGFTGSASPTKVAVGAFSPGLTETGLLRQCSRFDPDVGTAEDRWVPIGTCGKDQVGRDLGVCWLFKPSVERNIKDVELEDKTIEQLPALAEKLSKEVTQIDILSKEEVNGANELANALVEKKQYGEAIEYYRKVVGGATDDKDAAKAQFMIGESYRAWAKSIIEVPSAKTEEKKAEEGKTESKEKQLANKVLGMRVLDLDPSLDKYNVEKEGVILRYYVDLLLKTKFGLKVKYGKEELASRRSKSKVQFNPEDTVGDFIKRLAVSYGVEYEVDDQGYIVFKETKTG